jgi:hypothetical protein
MTAPADPSEALRTLATQLSEGWDELLPTLEQNPATYEPHVPGASLDAITEIVSTISNWVGRVRAPAGTSPAFHLGRTLASASLSAAVSALTSIRQGQYGHLPAFLSALLQVTNALHSQLVFAEPDETRTVAADATGHLAAALAELQATRTELGGAISQLSAAEELVERLTQAVESAVAENEKAAVAAQGAVEAGTKAAEAAAATSEALGESEKDAESLSDLVKRASDLSTKLEDLQLRLSQSQALAAEQQKLIAALLPQGASAGLASAFAQRVNGLEKTKWAWAVAFLAAVGFLGWQGFRIAPEALALTSSEVGAFLLKRIPTSGPFIWIAWFCAIQYGQTLRLQEDYAFKEATSKAFEGYRDHLEHLGSVSLTEGNTAMTLLAARTIDVLSHEPGRIYGSADRDATPASGILDRLLRRTK